MDLPGRAYSFYTCHQIPYAIGSDPKHFCSDILTGEYLMHMYADLADPLRAIVVNYLCIDPLIPPTVETLR